MKIRKLYIRKFGISEILVVEVMHRSNGYLIKVRIEVRLSSQVEGGRFREWSSG